jgi:hypothetical protein
MITTTLNAIREESPCADGWTKLLKHLGKTQADNEPLSFVTILDSNGLADALWCLRAAPEHKKIWQLYNVWCARQVQHLLTDPRSLAALDVAERYAHGLATDEELEDARAAAWDAAEDAARAAAEDAAWAAARAVAGDAAKAAARDAAWAVAWAAAWDADEAAAGDAARAAAMAVAWAADEAADEAVAGDAAWDAARDAAEDAQAAEFRRIVTETAV